MKATIDLCLGCFNVTRTEHGSCSECGWENSHQGKGLHLEPGQELHGRYILGRVLGHGGFGITYLGYDFKLLIKVAVKEYLYTNWASRIAGTTSVVAHSGKEQDFAEGVKNFLDEARTLARFKQELNIISVTDFFMANGTGYLVMDYEEGETLKSYLAKQPGGKLPWQETLRIFLQVMVALRQAHNFNIIHRDVSPDNIYLTDAGPVKVLDFGNARHYDAEKSQSLSAVLKDGYAPPEQYSRKGKQGPWTDVYAVGACLYNAISGIVPPQGLDRRMGDELLPIQSLSSNLPSRLAAIIHKALSLDAAERYQSIEEMRILIQEIKVPKPWWQQLWNRNKKLIQAMAASLLILGWGNVFRLFYQINNNVEPRILAQTASDSVKPMVIPERPIILPVPETPQMAYLTVKTDPSDAQIEITDPVMDYTDGMEIVPGQYRLEISRNGYQTKKVKLSLKAGGENHSFKLEKSLVALSVRTEPANAKVRILGSSIGYYDGIKLKPGSYAIEVSALGYKSQNIVQELNLEERSKTVSVSLQREYTSSFSNREEAYSNEKNNNSESSANIEAADLIKQFRMKK